MDYILRERILNRGNWNGWEKLKEMFNILGKQTTLKGWLYAQEMANRQSNSAESLAVPSLTMQCQRLYFPNFICFYILFFILFFSL